MELISNDVEKFIKNIDTIYHPFSSRFYSQGLPLIFIFIFFYHKEIKDTLINK